MNAGMMSRPGLLPTTSYSVDQTSDSLEQQRTSSSDAERVATSRRGASTFCQRSYRRYFRCPRGSNV